MSGCESVKLAAAKTTGDGNGLNLQKVSTIYATLHRSGPSTVVQTHARTRSTAMKQPLPIAAFNLIHSELDRHRFCELHCGWSSYGDGSRGGKPAQWSTQQEMTQSGNSQIKQE